MNKMKFYTLFIVWLLQSCGENDPLKEEFRDKIIKSFPSVKEFSFIDPKKIIYIDTAYKMPEPVYKIMVLTGEAANDPVFFYYYHVKDHQRVFELRYNSGEFTFGTRLFDCGNFLTDTTTGNFLVFFRNCRSMPERDLDPYRVPFLDSALSANFGFLPPKVTLEEIRVERAEPELPPPPPPPKPK